MHIIISLQGHEAAAVSEELRRLVSVAYEQGRAVAIPANVVEKSCADLSSQTSDEILAIRRRERAVSAQTLAYSFA